MIFLGLKSEGKEEQAAQLSQQTLERELGVNLDILLQLPEEAFIKGLQASGRLQLKHLDVIATMLFGSLEGLEKGTLGIDREKLIRRLILLLNYLDETDSSFSLERHYQI